MSRAMGGENKNIKMSKVSSKKILPVLIVSLLTLSGSVALGMTSTNYKILSDSINVGGTEGQVSSPGGYKLTKTIGEVGTGVSTSSGYKLKAGYRQLDEVVVYISLTVPPTPPTEVKGAVLIKDTTSPAIFNLLLSKITLNSATLSWETNEQALCQLFWGKTSEYKEEAISETAFYWKHSTKIINLLAATTYYFKIVCQDTSKNQAETTGQQFTTLTPPDITPPANVANFEAIPEDGQIALTWKNPPDPDFKAVKIVKSEDFYPTDPWDGTVVYDNKETSFVDTGLTNGVRYFYTAFAYDRSGNYASGAIASAVPSAVPPIVPPVIPAPIVPPPIVPAPPEIEKITIEEFEFIQEGKKLVPKDGKIELKSDLPLTASLAYEKVPEVLKTIMVTLERENKLFSFLLRINKEKTAYEAIIQAPEPGIYPLTISVLDYKNQTLKQIPGQLEVLKAEGPERIVSWQEKSRLYIYILLALILVGLMIYSLRKFRKLKY